MAIILPSNVRGPMLELTLPPSASALEIILRNNTTGKTLTVQLPAAWAGDDLTFDWYRRTIRDQTGADRSALLDPEDTGLWLEKYPLDPGSNDVEIEAVSSATETQSNRSPTVLANDASIGSVAWTSPGNAASSDDVRASAVVSVGKPSNYLKATGFGFTVPAGRIIGVRFPIEKSASPNGTVVDSSVRLVKGGVIAGEDRSKVTPWTLTEFADEYGSATDLHGLSLTPADVNAPDFGVVLGAKENGGGGTARVDQVRATVTFKAAVAYGATASLRWEKGYY